MYSLLLVDDEEIILNGLEEYIDWKSLNISHVHTASSAENALSVLTENVVDIVITDIRMPVFDGLYLSERIRKEYKDIKILILSGYDDFEYAKGAIHLGVEDYLLKPVDFNELKTSVKIILKKIQEERSIDLLKDELESHRIDQFFNDLIFGNKQNKSFGTSLIVVPKGHFYLVRMLIPDKGVLSECKRKLKSAIQNSVDKINEISAYYVFNNIARESTLAVYTQSEKTLENLASSIRSQVSFSLVLGSSSRKETLDEIAEAYDEAGNAINYQYVDSNSLIIFFSRIQQTFFRSVPENTHIRKSVVELLPQGIQKLEIYLFSLVDKYRNESGVSHEIYEDLVRAYISIYNYYLRLHEENVPDVYVHIKRLFSSETSVDLKSAISEYLDCCNRSDLHHDSLQTNIIEKARDHIENYYYQNITLNYLSEILYIHPNYLSRLFKEKTGRNFSKYLMSVRVEMAKKLLLNKKLRIYQIAEMVGYGSNKYFVKVFKESTGLLPKEYRDTLNPE